MGTYTDIVEIDAPSSAVAGETVPVTVRVKNIHSYGFSISVAATYIPGPVRFIGPEDHYVAAGATRSWSGSFTMPASDVTIWAYSSYWDGNYWRSDDEISKDVNLAEVVEGTISRKELEYDEARASIPAYDIPQNDRGLVHIWGRNDTSSNQKMGIHWLVYDPDGVVVEEYSRWETFWTGPGNAQEFIGGRFSLDKVGTYSINIALSMNPDNPEIVDTYYGTLCTVEAAVPEPSFRRFGMEEYTKT